MDRDVFKEDYLKIFSYLPQKSLAQCCLVNSTFKEICENEKLVQNLSLQLKTVPEVMLHRKINKMNISNLRLQTVTINPSMRNMKQTPCNLHYLDLRNIGPLKVINGILGRCQLLEGLYLADCQMDQQSGFHISDNHGLKYLSLICCSISQSDLVFNAIFRSCKDLLEMKLRWSPLNEENPDLDLSALAPSMRKLEINGFKLLADESIRCLTESCIDISTLCLECCNLLSLQSLQLVTSLPNLKLLRCSPFLGTLVDDYRIYCNGLERLEFVYCEKNILDQLKRDLPNLTITVNADFNEIANPAKALFQPLI